MNLDHVLLKSGSHASREDGMCANEFFAFVAREEHSDAPLCVCPSIRAITMRFNDRCGDGPEADARRTRVLGPLGGASPDGSIPADAYKLGVVYGTRGSKELTQRRAWAAADWSFRSATPRVIALTSLGPVWVPKLQAMDPIVSEASLVTALPLMRAMREEAWAARSAAYAKIRSKYAAAVAVAAAEAEAAAEAAVAVAAAEAAAEAAVAAAEAEAAAEAAVAAAEAVAVAAAAVAEAAATAVAADPKLVAIAQAVLDKGGDYWAAIAACRTAIRERGSYLIRPQFLALRDELDAEFGGLVRRLCAMRDEA